MANIFRVYKDSQVTADRIRAENAAARLDNAPERRLYVFGGADGTFPYFASFGSALTYANALTPAPSTSHPVSIVLLSKQNGDPEVITGNDDWYALCLDGIYVSSPYREIFSTTTLPTTLPKGMRVMYEDANGVESLWVGNADGNAWPAVGYKEYVALVTQTGTNAPVATVLSNTIGTLTWTRQGVGEYSLLSLSSVFPANKSFPNQIAETTGQFAESMTITLLSRGTTTQYTLISQNADILSDTATPQDSLLSAYPVSIRIYP